MSILVCRFIHHSFRHKIFVQKKAFLSLRNTQKIDAASKEREKKHFLAPFFLKKQNLIFSIFRLLLHELNVQIQFVHLNKRRKKWASSQTNQQTDKRNIIICVDVLINNNNNNNNYVLSIKIIIYYQIIINFECGDAAIINKLIEHK